MRVLAIAVATACVAAVAASTGSASARRGVQTYATRSTSPLRTGVFDPFTFNGNDYVTGMALARKAGATYIRITIPWAEVAQAAPPSDSATDPNWWGYHWGWPDAKVTAAENAGLTPYLQIGSTPSWAIAKLNTPKVALLRQFATALALHYDGKHGAPAVHIFQVWNEPNLSLDLGPAKPAVYRSMVNAVADSVHKVNRKNLVVAGGLDPFSNRTKKWYSVAPLAFMRAMLCVSKGKHPHRTCKSQVHFDVWAHHPYTFGGPFAHARRPDDVSLGDLPEMRAVLNAARRLHRIVAPHRPQFWVTEFGWGSSPPKKKAAPVALAARWTAESLYQMWRSGVTVATWYTLEDQPKPSPYGSGLYYHAKTLTRARAKSVRTAFRFPFVAYLGRGTVRVWGRTATSSKKRVTIQRRVSRRGHWRTVARIEPNRFGIFKATLRTHATKRYWFRAIASGSGKSLAFSLTVPHPRIKYGPWGHA